LTYAAQSLQWCGLCRIRVGKNMSRIINYLFICTLFLTSTCFAQPPKIPTSADISVNKIFLGDIESQNKVLGTDVKFIDSFDTHPSAIFSNTSNSEYLTAIIHEGGSGEIEEFRISYQVHAKNLAIKPIATKKFTTGKNIHLGITKSHLISTLGKPIHRASKGKFETYEYRIEDEEMNKSNFLIHYNMPIYFGSYTFKNDKLVSFQFGFEYP
jgi:hypothetical protein